MSSCKTTHFSDLSRLQQHEIAYLNICSWFYPQYLELTKYLETLDLAITYNGQKYPIKSWGLYHSLIGDLPTNKRIPSGGHCNYQNMLSNCFIIEDEISLAHGFKQATIKHARSKGSKPSTLFPRNWSPKKCVQEVVNAIKNPKSIHPLHEKSNNAFKVIDQNKRQFAVCMQKEGHITFFPIKE